MKKLLLLFAIVSIVAFCKAQFPSHVTILDCPPNKTSTFTGDLANGAIMEDLSWASTSSNACFPATQNTKFRGNHVLYATKLPAYSEMKITVIPDDKNANFSIYGYQIGETNYSVVPDLAKCVACEAEHKWDYPKKGKTQDHTRSIEFNSIDGAYNIVIGVAGADGLKTGKYTLKIELVTKITDNTPQEQVKIWTCTSQKGKTLGYKGNLADGVEIKDLSWAWNSSVACFPATQANKFNGNHVIYTTTLPAHSTMTVKLIPDDKNANLSLYAYQIGINKNEIVPNLSSCVACEADHKWDYPKKGKTQDHTRTITDLTALEGEYKIVIGVAGADKLKTGTFVIQIKVE